MTYSHAKLTVWNEWYVLAEALIRTVMVNPDALSEKVLLGTSAKPCSDKLMCGVSHRAWQRTGRDHILLLRDGRLVGQGDVF